MATSGHPKPHKVFRMSSNYTPPVLLCTLYIERACLSGICWKKNPLPSLCNKSFLYISQFVWWQLLYLFQLTGVTDSSFAEVWCGFTVCTFYCLAQHGVFNICTGAPTARFNSYLHIHRVGAPAGLSRPVLLPLWKRRCIIHVRYFPSFHILLSLSLSLSISPIVTVDWCYIPAFPFRRTHWTTKQFLYLHAWGDTVSLAHS